VRRAWLCLPLLPLLFAAGLPAPASAAAPPCTRAKALATARTIHLGGRDVLQATQQAFCGAFAGRGSRVMVASYVGEGSLGLIWWAAYRQVGGSWQLATKRRAAAKLAPVGSDFKETTNIFRPGDPRCCPSGGTRSRVWHWNGARFVAGAWTKDDPWPAIGRQVGFTVYEPSDVLGLPLTSVEAIPCGSTRSWVLASYERGQGADRRGVRLYEGKPDLCGDPGEHALVGEVAVNGTTVPLYVYARGGQCDGGACTVDDGFENGFLVFLQPAANGTRVALDTHHVTQDELVRVASSLHVP
jgi:hypothetical protein